MSFDTSDEPSSDAEAAMILPGAASRLAVGSHHVP